jgi:hypothetical protein
MEIAFVPIKLLESNTPPSYSIMDNNQLPEDWASYFGLPDQMLDFPMFDELTDMYAQNKCPSTPTCLMIHCNPISLI